MGDLASNREVRLTGLGGSDAATAVGLNPYKTRYQLYLEKIEEVEPEDLSDKEAVQWGIIHEDNVARVYAEKMKVKVRRNNRTLRHTTYPFMMAHLDREVVGQNIILECKTAHEYLSGSWGEEFTAEVPEHYLIQCLHYLIVTGKSECHLAVLIGGNKHRIYIIKREDFPEECDRLPQALRRFWEMIQRKEPPVATNAVDLGLMYPTDTKPFVVAGEDEYEAVKELVRLKAQIKGTKKIISDLEFIVKKAFANAAELHYKGSTLATWKGQSGSRLDTKKLKAAEPELCRTYTVETQNRVLRPKLKEGETIGE